MKRREFLNIIGVTGAAGAASALGGCARGGGPGHLMPYLVPTEEGTQPGVNVEYATVCRECPAGCGMLAVTRDGRVHKVEGNPNHPVNRGKLCWRGQTALQGVYNPDRFTGPMARDDHGRLVPISWAEANRRFLSAVAAARSGHALWIGRLETGTLDGLIDRWLAAVAPQHTRLRYEPLAYEPLRAAHARVFGAAGVPALRIDRAKMILSFGADFLETWVSNVEYTRQYSAWRQARVAGQHQGRYVFVGSRLSLTGQNADEWIGIRTGTELAFVQAITLIVDAVRAGQPAPTAEIAPLAAVTGVKPETMERIGREFASASPGLALPPDNGQNGPESVDTIEAILRLNVASGSVGKTLIPGWPHALSAASTARDMADAIALMEGGSVGTVFLHHVNPAYNLPPSSGFSEAIAKAREVISFASFPDETTGAPGETGGYATLTLPDHTPLESWGDYTPRPGITGVMQPVIAPVFDTRQTADLLLSSAAIRGGHAGARTMEDYLPTAHGLDEAAWDTALQIGGVFTTRDEVIRRRPGNGVSLGTDGIQIGGADAVASRPAIEFATSVFALPPAGTPAAGTPPAGTPAAGVPAAAPPSGGPAAAGPAANEGQMYLRVYPSLQFYDGRLANRPWAQEIPDAVSKAVWGSWAEVHPDTMQKLQIKNGDLIEVRTGAGKVNIPALHSYGVRADTIAVQMGQGHTLNGQYSSGIGVNPLSILPFHIDAASGAMVIAPVPVSVRGLAGSRPIITLQTGDSQNGATLSVTRNLTDLTQPSPAEKPREDFKEAQHKDRVWLYNAKPPAEHPRTHHRWGMSIDLDRCVGCNACVSACYAENNVPVVGPDDCWRGREMSWIRVETYVGRTGPEADDPAVMGIDLRFFPMLCMQCNNAPCEYVCPVFATEHSDEGLNMQVYNRCVGTRYCSNNCPYKVRRFNWFTYPFPFPLDQQLNPDVIHRTKGVMEKCSFCIQRIRREEINEAVGKEPIRDGQIQTACMQACPADAIIFGDHHDEKSRVNELYHDKSRGYGALEELNTFPNVQYMERVVVDKPEVV